LEKSDISLSRWNLPNLITGLNLLSGCTALVFAFEGKLVHSSVFIGVGLLFDFLDGFSARLLGIKSSIGKELDSLADVITFGVVPGTLVYLLMQQDLSAPQLFAGKTNLLPFFGFLLPLFAAFRLAQFNLDERQERVFYGLPTPAMAIFFGSIPLILAIKPTDPATWQRFTTDLAGNFYVLAALTLLFAWLMVSGIPLFSLKFKSFHWGGNQLRYGFLGLAVVLIVVFHYTAFPLIVLLYVLISLLFPRKVGS
jgi:CDP-diacylglycerol--serine O-phosphatidyltransferase